MAVMLNSGMATAACAHTAAALLADGMLPLCHSSNHGLAIPSNQQAYEAKGVTRMYPWQAAALECGEAYNNLVCCPCLPASLGRHWWVECACICRNWSHAPHTIRSR